MSASEKEKHLVASSLQRIQEAYVCQNGVYVLNLFIIFELNLIHSRQMLISCLVVAQIIHTRINDCLGTPLKICRLRRT